MIGRLAWGQRGRRTATHRLCESHTYSPHHDGVSRKYRTQTPQRSPLPQRGDWKQGLTSCDQIGIGNCNITHIWRLGCGQCWCTNCGFERGGGHRTEGGLGRGYTVPLRVLTHRLAVQSRVHSITRGSAGIGHAWFRGWTWFWGGSGW